MMKVTLAKDLTSLSLDELIGNLKVYETLIKKDSEIVKAKGERKSLALKAKKESSDDEISTSGSEDEECGDSNHLIRECLKPPKDKNQRAFVGGSWSDSDGEDNEKAKHKTCLMAYPSSEVYSKSSYFSDENSPLDDIILDSEYNRFETYVKSKDLDIWHVITEGDFLPIQNNLETKLDEVVPFEKQNDDLKKRLAKNNEAKKSLKAHDEGYSSKNYVRKFLRALHPKLKAKVTTIEESKDLTSLSLDELIGNLKVYEMLIKKDYEIVKAKGERKSLALKAKKESSDEEISTSGSEDEEYAMAVRDFKKFFKRRGRCGDPNHLIRECPKPPKDKNQRAFVGGSWSDSGGEDDEKAKHKTCLMAYPSSEVHSESSYFSDENSPIDYIILNSEYNRLYMPYDRFGARRMDKRKRMLQTHDGKSKALLNLQGQICDNKCKVIFSKHDSGITKDGKVIGHANMHLIQSLASKELVRNLPKLKFDQHFCDACKIGKQANASHESKNIVSTTRCLELLHMDLFGPSAVRSYGGNLYTLVIVDKYSRSLSEQSLNELPSRCSA
ncbi:hypothetical protein Tco_1393304 [Tanacetum coccineum]